MNVFSLGPTDMFPFVFLPNFIYIEGPKFLRLYLEALVDSFTSNTTFLIVRKCRRKTGILTVVCMSTTTSHLTLYRLFGFWIKEDPDWVSVFIRYWLRSDSFPSIQRRGHLRSKSNRFDYSLRCPRHRVQELSSNLQDLEGP